MKFSKISLILLLTLGSFQARARDIVIQADTPTALHKTVKNLSLGLTPADRQYITVWPSINLNTCYLKINIKHQSDSPNFRVLQKLYADRDYTLMIRLNAPTDLFSSLFARLENGRLRLVPFEEMYQVKNHVSTESGFTGWTLFPLTAAPVENGMYSADANMRIYVADDMPAEDISATIHHELRHAYLSQGGRQVLSALHDEPGVNAQTTAAEREAHRNFVR